MMRELVGEHGEDVEFRSRAAECRHRIEDAGHGAHATGVGAEPVVHLAIAVDGYAHEEAALGEEGGPGVVDDVPVGLDGQVHRLLRAMLIDVGAEGAEEVETRARGLAALEGEGHLGIGTQGEGAVDHRLDRRGVHDAVVGDLAVLRDVGVKAVAAAHVASGASWFDEKRDVLHGSSQRVVVSCRRVYHDGPCASLRASKGTLMEKYPKRSRT